MTLRTPPSRIPKDFLDEEFTVPFDEPRGRAPAAARPRPADRTPASDLRRPASSTLHLSLYRKIATLFVLAALGTLGFVLYISFARAQVVIVPKAEAVSTEVTLSVSPEAKGDLTVPGYVLETVVDGQKTVQTPAGADAKTVEGIACGTVTITNGQTKAQPLVATTRLLSPEGVLFRITAGVTVPAGGTVDVKACADKPGASGDIGPTRFTIPGLNPALQEKTYAESKAAMTGGLSRVAVLAQEAVDQAAAAFADELAAEALRKLRALVPSPELANGTFVTKNLVKTETDAKPGTEQASFTLSLSLHVVGVFYDPMALGQAAGAALRASVGAEKELTSVDSSSLDATLEKADAVGKTASVTVKIAGTAVARGAEGAFDKARIAGLSPKAAEQYLLSLPSVSSARITLTPFWARKIPKLVDHIDITVEGSGQ